MILNSIGGNFSLEFRKVRLPLGRSTLLPVYGIMGLGERHVPECFFYPFVSRIIYRIPAFAVFSSNEASLLRSTLGRLHSKVSLKKNFFVRMDIMITIPWPA